MSILDSEYEDESIAPSKMVLMVMSLQPIGAVAVGDASAICVDVIISAVAARYIISASAEGLEEGKEERTREEEEEGKMKN